MKYMPLTTEEREKILKDQEQFIDDMEEGFAESEKKEHECAIHIAKMEEEFRKKKEQWDHDRDDIEDKRVQWKKTLALLKITPEERWTLKHPQVEAALHSFRDACNKARAHLGNS